MNQRLMMVIVGLALMLGPVRPANVFAAWIPIENVQIVPETPTTSDALTITASGEIGYAGVPIAYTDYSRSGNVQSLDIFFHFQGIGLPVVVGWSDSQPIGMLPAGTYNLTVCTYEWPNLVLADAYSINYTVLSNPSTHALWASAVSGNWSTPGNWTGGVPNAVAAEAVINASTTAALTITLDSPQTVGALVLGNSGSATFGYTLSGTGANTLTLNNSGSAATIAVTSGSHVIDAPLMLADNLVVSGSGELCFDNSSSITGIGKSLTMSGTGGKLILSGSDTYSGGTNVVGGTLVVTSSMALPDGTSLTVGTGGSLIFDPAPDEAAPLAASPGALVAAVPEPGTLVLFTASTLLATFAAWQRRQIPTRRKMVSNACNLYCGATHVT